MVAANTHNAAVLSPRSVAQPRMSTPPSGGSSAPTQMRTTPKTTATHKTRSSLLGALLAALSVGAA